MAAKRKFTSETSDYERLLHRLHDDAMKKYVSTTDFYSDPALFNPDDDQSDLLEEETYQEEVQQETTDEPTSFNGDPTQVPLYAGATITIATSMLLIIAFVMRHSLTGAAVSDLLTLIDLHCLSPNYCKRNLKSFLNYFECMRDPVEFHHFCEDCHAYLGSSIPTNRTCPICDKKFSKDPPYFLVIPIVQQLTSLFKDSSLLQKIKEYKDCQSKRQDSFICDTLDGELYKERFTKEGFFRGEKHQENEVHISLQINTDGVSLFSSSKFSIWPVYFVINELPPNIRFTRTNRIFAGLWFGNTKPNFRVFMQPFAESLLSLYNTGFTVGNERIRGFLFSGVFDAPARCLFQEMVQFNGFHGCPYCLAPGESVKTSERGHTHAYPFNKHSNTGHHEPRNHSQLLEHAEEAERKKINKVKGNEFGVKGRTWSQCLPKFDAIRGVAIDYMHCVTLGVMKMLMSLWFEKSYKHEAFNISNKLQQVNTRLLACKPPAFVSRLPRSLYDMSHFKASEYKAFLLFYSLPCLYGILPEDNYYHFLLFVQAIHMLLTNKISVEQLKQCKKMLMHFCININVLYGDRYMTSNVHLLLHLTERVQDLGPLWATSCFYFEDFNGQLRNLFHGTRGIQEQIAFAVSAHQKLPGLAKMFDKGTMEYDFFSSLFIRSKKPTVTEDVCESSGMVGRAFNCSLKEQEKSAIEIRIGPILKQTTFRRALHNNFIIHSNCFNSGSRRNNNTIKFCDHRFGTVRKFVRVTSHSNSIYYFAIVDTMLEIPCLANNCNLGIIKTVTASGYCEAVPMSDINSLCVSCEATEGNYFVTVPPNQVERE